ncbi:hypothetical protein DPEC_G00355830 [Dallia pectoralis]|uniref:Uncharacterized protein n=1 Tax=Dallia pectoralis TaxID=75939 RepID=A0ACC2EZL4_DALPE|nr:hypothetical protein DPEC_G00355830 [Dallia pectoralis]
MRLALRPRSGCLVLCLSFSLLALLLQSLWVPPDVTKEGTLVGAGRSPEEQGHQGHSVRRLALRLEALNSQVQRLTKERDSRQLAKEDISLLLQSLQQDQKGLVRSVEKELQRMAQKLDRLARVQSTPRLLDNPRPQTGVHEVCVVPEDPAYPHCAEKVEFLGARWNTDPCYSFYGVDGTMCSILTYLSEWEDFCPLRPGRNHSAAPWQQQPRGHTEKAEIRTTLSLLYEEFVGSQGPAGRFMRSRLERLSSLWVKTGQRMREKVTNQTSPQKKVLLYPGVLSGGAGQRFGDMVNRGGPLGELVQWADLSASLYVLGHNVTFTTSQHHLRSVIGAAPGRGSCPIQRPLTFDLIYTDYHGLTHFQGAMGLAFQHYQCRFRILDSFGTEPAFNLGTYAHRHGYKTLWGSWGLRPMQYMTMFPHTPDNSFLGFVSEGEAALSRQQEREEEGEPRAYVKDNMALVYGKQDYMWQGKESYLDVIGRELETHGTVYQPPGHNSAQLPGDVINHGLLTQDQFLQLLRRAKVFVGLGFPYEGPAPLEAIASGCVFLQPRFQPPLSSETSDFYKGKPTTRLVSSQHPYAEVFIGKPFVWTVDLTNKTEVQETVRAILRTEVKPFTPREFTCDGMLERVHAYITHQDFCSMSFPTWPPEGALRVHLGPLGDSCGSVCGRASLVCEPALFHHLNSPAAFSRLGLSCSSMDQEVDNHLFPAYSPWGRRCGLQRDRLLFSCAGSDLGLRRLCPCRGYQPGQVALCPEC